MEKNEQIVFRRKTLDRIASPEQLTDYLRVTNPGIWVILAAVILLLAGVLAWSMVGTLETKVEVKVVVSDHTAQIISLESEPLAEGMPLRVIGQESVSVFTPYRVKYSAPSSSCVDSPKADFFLRFFLRNNPICYR